VKHATNVTACDNILIIYMSAYVGEKTKLPEEIVHPQVDDNRYDGVQSNPLHCSSM
jgi:hypothetical protein